MSAFVVDTNVPIVANGAANHADPDCVLACIDALEQVRNEGMIVLDSGSLILREYMNNLNMAGQPGLGDLFMKWVCSIQAVPAKCEQVTLTPKGDDPDDFEEFPDDPELAGFDRSDRKFAAVAIESVNQPPVLNAVDTDWWNFREPLSAHGVNVEFLCPDQMNRARRRR